MKVFSIIIIIINFSVSRASGNKINLDLLLGGVRSTDGKITGARFTKMTYFLKNQEVFDQSQGKNVCSNKHLNIFIHFILISLMGYRLKQIFLEFNE